MLTSTNLLAQDRTEHVLCPGGTKILSSPLAHDPEYCYMWTPEYALVDPDDQHNREVEVGPEVTTLFKLKITNTVNGELVYEAEYIVYVVEGISIELLRQEKDECFHGEDLLFRAKLVGQQLETALDEPFNVEFSIADFTQSSLLSYDYSALNTFYFLRYTTDRIFLDPDHEHLLKVKARITDDEGWICFESELEINVIQFYITAFNQREINKEWKVVVAPTGNNQTVLFDNHSKIIHDVKTPQYCTEFEWAMEDPWLLEGSSINQKSGNELFINNSSMPTATSWDLFGEKRGNVMVKCTDYLGVERMLNSSKLGRGSSTSSELMSPPKSVKVFFHKWDDNPDPPNNMDWSDTYVIPNWFYYWQKVIPHGIENIEYALNHNFGGSNCQKSLGYTQISKQSRGVTLLCKECGNLMPLRRNEWCLAKKGWITPERDIPGGNLTGTGIEAFFINIKHEAYHYTILDEIWDSNPNDNILEKFHTNYNQLLDEDEDYYLDTWETTVGSEQERWFDVPRDENSMPKHGTAYECWDEPETRIYENKVLGPILSMYNSKDWSYEKDEAKSLYQGKNWN